jgi:hypothetical protein
MSQMGHKGHIGHMGHMGDWVACLRVQSEM